MWVGGHGRIAMWKLYFWKMLITTTAFLHSKTKKDAKRTEPKKQFSIKTFIILRFLYETNSSFVNLFFFFRGNLIRFMKIKREGDVGVQPVFCLETLKARVRVYGIDAWRKTARETSSTYNCKNKLAIHKKAARCLVQRQVTDHSSEIKKKGTRKPKLRFSSAAFKIYFVQFEVSVANF